MEEQKYLPTDFPWEAEFHRYPSGDLREHGKTRIDHRDKMSKIRFDLRDLNLSPQ